MISHPSLEGEKVVAWARVYATASRSHSKNLRHGTWYPVIADHLPDRVSLRVGVEKVDVPRTLLEIREKRPIYFSLVTMVATRESAASRAGQAGLGKHYLVCPDCDHRNPFFGHPERSKCKKCGYEGDVAWWDS